MSDINQNSKFATRYKMTMKVKKYIVHEHNKTITCIMECEFPDLPFNTKVYRKFDLGICNDFIVKGVAKCRPGDTYDEQTGCRIAESKAKLKAFKKAEKIMRTYYENVLLEMCNTKHSISFFEEEYKRECCHYGKLIK